MGILNVTPDSFADGGERLDPDRAIRDGIRMAAHGADILDVGGESTRPGATPIDADEERRRVEPVLEGLRGRVDVPLSIDTYKAAVAARALDLGATIVNDVSALTYDPAIAGVIAHRRAAVVLMHNRGRSSDIYRFADYADVGAEVTAELTEAVRRAESAGIPRDRVILDPGVGFAKRAPQSIELLAHLPALAAIGRPILVGPSRKSFLKAALGDVPPDQRVWGTAAAVAAAVFFGAHIVRVHDVAEMTQVVKVADLIFHPLTLSPSHPFDNLSAG
jgi:dihydropteroate synthase